MQRTLAVFLTVIFILVFSSGVAAQEEARAAWQINRFDINANLQLPQRLLAATALLSATNVGRGLGSSFTFRINGKASIKTVTVGSSSANFRTVPESYGNLQRVTVTLPAGVAPDGSLALNISYSLPVESNTGLAAISPIGSQFLPMSFWYPAPSTPYTGKGADTAPVRVVVNGAGVISSGVEKSDQSGSVIYENALNGEPFFLQSDWEKVDGTGENKNISAFVTRGSPVEDRKRAEALIALAGSARAFYAGLLGAAPEAPIRLVSVRRGAGFDDSGTVLLESGAFHRAQLDSTTALLISEAIARLWIGGQTPVRAEGGAVLREGLVRFLATQFIEKQFGQSAAETERIHERLAYSAVVLREAPLSKVTALDPTYFSTVPNKGAMVWRLVERRLGHDAFINIVREVLVSGKGSGMTLAALRSVIAQRGGDAIRILLDQLLDQSTDLDLMIGLPQQRGSESVSALRNVGAIDVVTTVTATTASGQQISVDITVPGRGFAEAVFKTSARVIRVEIDPEKLYPQVDYANDSMPRTPELRDALAEATRLLGAQDFVKAESSARAILANTPQMQEAGIILARALLGQNRTDEAEKLFRSLLALSLPTPAAIAWANIGLGEISLKKGRAAEAASLFTAAVRADAEYASSLAARNGRIRAEMAANLLQVDPAIRNFIGQLDQAIASGKKVELEPRVGSGELVRFISGVVGTQPEVWRTKALRTEQWDADLFAADVSLETKELGKEQSGTALYILSRSNGNWKLVGIDLFEVR
ncbi:MAG: tetratricopeptide repeat protein [Blastocatellia bacterium]|nr:tetratricopeptide repeat protein [Blastocatellia bacterium]